MAMAMVTVTILDMVMAVAKATVAVTVTVMAMVTVMMMMMAMDVAIFHRYENTMFNLKHIPSALVLGCNTPHGINILSDYIEKLTGHSSDFYQSG